MRCSKCRHFQFVSWCLYVFEYGKSILLILNVSFLNVSECELLTSHAAIAQLKLPSWSCLHVHKRLQRTVLDCPQISEWGDLLRFSHRCYTTDNAICTFSKSPHCSTVCKLSFDVRYALVNTKEVQFSFTSIYLRCDSVRVSVLMTSPERITVLVM